MSQKGSIVVGDESLVRPLAAESIALVVADVATHMPRVVAVVVVGYAARTDEEKLREWFTSIQPPKWHGISYHEYRTMDGGRLTLTFISKGNMIYATYVCPMVGHMWRSDLSDVALAVRGMRSLFRIRMEECGLGDHEVFKDMAATVARW